MATAQRATRSARVSSRTRGGRDAPPRSGTAQSCFQSRGRSEQYNEGQKHDECEDTPDGGVPGRQHQERKREHQDIDATLAMVTPD